jgi:hypothetical protein
MALVGIVSHDDENGTWYAFTVDAGYPTTWVQEVKDAELLSPQTALAVMEYAVAQGWACVRYTVKHVA